MAPTITTSGPKPHFLIAEQDINALMAAGNCGNHAHVAVNSQCIWTAVIATGIAGVDTKTFEEMNP